MDVINSFVVSTGLVVAGWWILARRRFPLALTVLSAAALGLAGLTLVVEGARWQLVPWQALACFSAAAAVMRWWRPGVSHRWTRVLGRLILLLTVVAGGVGFLFVRVPSLPQPAGSHLVGSQVFRWTDSRRPETFSLDPTERRQVVAQAWFPADAASGGRVPYFETQDRLPPSMDFLPSWFFKDFGQVDTHATMSASISSEWPTWPVLVFSPGWGSLREDYTGLATDLASRGYVVIVLSHPYETPAALLADGRVVDQSPRAGILSANMADLTAIRTADISFVLDQLVQFDRIEAGSTLAGHLDLEHVGIVGHSLGGATAVQVIATDPRFKVGVNIDGTLPPGLSSAPLDRPFLWIQSDGTQLGNYVGVRDELMGGLRQSGDVLVVGGSIHQSFTDQEFYFSAIGRRWFGDGVGPEAANDITWATTDVISAFVAPALGGPTDTSLDEAIARHPSVKQQPHIAALRAS